MPCVGNHEYLDIGPEIYRGTFDPPHNGPAEVDSNLVYSFEYSDAFVAVLDSNLGIYDSRLAKAQADWLDEALGEDQGHLEVRRLPPPGLRLARQPREPPARGRLGAGLRQAPRRHGPPGARPRLPPDPADARGKPVDSPSEGTVYVVSVSGEKFYEQDPRDYTARGMTNLATYQTIDVKVKERRLIYRSFDRDGREVNSLVIEKGAGSPRLAGPAGR